MAESYSHAWGQQIGELLEDCITADLGKFAIKHGLYLDKKGLRPVRSGKKAAWKDINGNKHDLDYVFERDGSPQKIGTPVAFIEVAWRRYTKHSRNKAQEIQGAIMPLVETHQKSAPFIGAIIAGVFTKGAIKQLQSLGFSILYFEYEGVIQAFKESGLDAAFDQKTSEKQFKAKLKTWNSLSPTARKKVGARIFRIYQDRITAFFAALETWVKREIETVFILPLHGAANTVPTVEDAISFVTRYDDTTCKLPLFEIIVEIRYNTGSKIEGRFKTKEETIVFLRGYLPAVVTPVTKQASSPS